MPSLQEQVAEVQLILASTAEEEFHWRGSDVDIRSWEALVAEESGDDDGPPLAFALKLNSHGGDSMGSGLWLNVEYAPKQGGEAYMTLQGPHVDRMDFDRVKRVVDERRREAAEEGFGNVVFDVYTAVQAHLAEEPVGASSHSEDVDVGGSELPLELERDVAMTRVIFWTHHLKAPSKKRDMTAWCSELSLWGLVKSGYPGYLCFEGQQDDVQEMVRRIKALQWHAITVKTEEPYSFQASDQCTTMGEARKEALGHCLLAKGHSAEGRTGAKLRTTMDEVESGRDLVERLKKASIPEDEYMFALNLRSGSIRG